MAHVRRGLLVAVVAALGCAAERAAPVPPRAVARRAAAPLTPPEGYVSVEVATVIPASDGAFTVVLVDPGRRWALPIAIGEAEARAIDLRLEGRKYPRPLTHDLIDTVVDRLGGAVVKVQVDDLRDGTFFGTVFLRHGERLLALDARPSDAIALAV